MSVESSDISVKSEGPSVTYEVLIRREEGLGRRCLEIFPSVSRTPPHSVNKEDCIDQEACVVVEAGRGGRVTEIRGWAYELTGDREKQIPPDGPSFRDLLFQKPISEGRFRQLIIAPQSPLKQLFKKLGLPTTLTVGKEVLPGVSSSKALFERMQQNYLEVTSPVSL